MTKRRHQRELGQIELFAVDRDGGWALAEAEHERWLKSPPGTPHPSVVNGSRVPRPRQERTA